LVVDPLNNKAIVDKMNQAIEDNNKNNIHIVLTSTNNNMNSSLNNQINSEFNHVHLINYPSNRRIEKHLVIAQHIAKYSENNYTYLEIEGKLKTKYINHLMYNGISHKKNKQNQSALEINSRLFIKNILKKTAMNQFRSIFITKAV